MSSGPRNSGRQRARVVAQVHEEHDHQRELGRRHHQEQRHDDRRERADVDDADLQRRHQREDDRDPDVGPDRGVLVGGKLSLRAVGLAAAWRARSRDQVDHGEDDDPHDVHEVPVQPTTSTLVASCTVSLPADRGSTGSRSRATPSATWPPWKPVSTKNVGAEQVLLQRQPLVHEVGELVGLEAQEEETEERGAEQPQARPGADRRAARRPGPAP